jgi:hypothetical protein
MWLGKLKEGDQTKSVAIGRKAISKWALETA